MKLLVRYCDKFLNIYFKNHSKVNLYNLLTKY